MSAVATARSAASARPRTRAARRRDIGPLLTILGGLLWVAAVGVAFQAQAAWAKGYSMMLTGALVMGGAAALAVLALALIDWRHPAPSLPRQWGPPLVWDWSRLATRLGVGLLAASGLLWAGCLYLLIRFPFVNGRPDAPFYSLTTPYGQAFWLWVPALVLAALGVAALDGRSDGWRFGWPRRRWLREAAIVLGLAALAVAWRLPGLTSFPPEVHGDEAAVGIGARFVMRGDANNLFSAGWAGIPQLSYAIPVPFMALFGDDLFGFRTASVVQGTLSIVFTYLLTRELFGMRIGLLAALLTTMAHWHVHFSRSGISYMQSLLATVLVLWLVVRGVRSAKPIYWLLAGFAAGVGFEVYYSSRLVPAVAALYVGHCLIKERMSFLRRQWAGMVAAVVGFVLFVGPLGVYLIRHPQILMNRASAVSITSPDVLHHLEGSLRVQGVVGVLLAQLANSLLAFNLLGEASLQYGHRLPLIDYWSGIFWALGLAVVTLRVTSSRYFLLAGWFWATLVIGGVMTVDALFSPRVLTLAPVLFIFVAIVVDAGWRAVGALGGRAAAYAFALPVAGFLVLSGQDNYDHYFVQHATRLQPAGFHTSLSRYINSVSDRYRVYWIGPPDAYLEYDTSNFLVREWDAVDYRGHPLDLPVSRVPGRKGIVFVVKHGWPPGEEAIQRIKQTYPGATEQLHSTTRGYPLFYGITVERDALLRTNPAAYVDDGEPLGVKRPDQVRPGPG